MALFFRIHPETRGAPVARGAVGHGAVGDRAVVHQAVADEDLAGGEGETFEGNSGLQNVKSMVNDD